MTKDTVAAVIGGLAAFLYVAAIIGLLDSGVTPFQAVMVVIVALLGVASAAVVGFAVYYGVIYFGRLVRWVRR